MDRMMMSMREALGPQMTQGLVDMCEYMVGPSDVIFSIPRHTWEITKSVMYEIGSFAGESAVIWARYFTTVHCVDPWAFDDLARISLAYRAGIEAAFDVRARDAGNIVKHKARSLDVAPTVADASVDFVYIDGDHSYKAALADITEWWPKVKAGGFLGGHDYSLADVRKATADFFKRAPDRTFNDLADLSNPEYQVGSWVYRKGE
jgi:cephalosporin hydroxylase